MSTKHDLVKDLLLADHGLFKEFFLADLHVAEKRVDYFITLSTAVLTLMGTLAGLSSVDLLAGFQYTDVLMITGFLLFSLLMVGRVIIVRIAYRNVSLERWKLRMALIRAKFRELTDSKHLKDYYPFRADFRKEPKDIQQWGRGGLIDLVQYMNTIILVVLAEIIIELIRNATGLVNPFWIVIMVIFGLLVFFGGIELQKRYVEKKTDDWKKEGLHLLKSKEIEKTKDSD